MSFETTNDSSTAIANRNARQRQTLRAGFAFAVLLWAAIVGFGLERLWRFKTTPGIPAQAVPQWPGSALIAPRSGQSTLVMFVHPQCSCTSASLVELRKLLERTHAPVATFVMLLQPRGMPDDWQRTRTAEAARTIPNVTVLDDRDGSEAARFNAQTSGQVVLFDSRGKLLFEGGITESRGHIGDNSGEESVISLIDTGRADRHEHAVYGCGFHHPQRADI